jgi:quercetin dioxygenase-like cupin family protein
MAPALRRAQMNGSNSPVGGLIEEGEAFSRLTAHPHPVSGPPEGVPHKKERIMITQSEQEVGTGALVAVGRGRQSLERSVWYSGWLLTFLATGEETNGQFSLMEQVARKGNVPPRHIHHREDETFYIVEGEMTFSVGDETIKATPGTMVFAPRDIPHSFTIDSEQVRMLVMVAPAGAEGFFKECSVPAPSMTLPPPADVPYSEIQKMMALAPEYGFEFMRPQH